MHDEIRFPFHERIFQWQVFSQLFIGASADVPFRTTSRQTIYEFHGNKFTLRNVSGFGLRLLIAGALYGQP